MPYCNNCGKPVTPTDRYCAECGAGQPGASQSSEFLKDVTPRTAAILCYIPVLGWLPSVVVLAAARFRDDRDVRFHAFQGLYLFVAWLIADWVVGPVAWSGHHNNILKVASLAGAFKALLLGVWIFMLVKTSQGETYRLPLIGELAERSVTSGSQG